MSEQEARDIMAEIAGRYRYRPERDPPAHELLGNSVQGDNLRLAMLQFGIELLVRQAVGRSEQFASEFTLPRYGLGGWALENYAENPAGSRDPLSVDMTFRFRLGDPNDPNRAARANASGITLRVLVTRNNQGVVFDVGYAGRGGARLSRVTAGIFPGSGGMTIVPVPSPSPRSTPAGRPRSTSAPHAPSRR